jgi:hypothetical protein
MTLNLQAVLATAQGASDMETPVVDRDVVDAAIHLAQRASEDGELNAEADPIGVALLVISALQGLRVLIAMFGNDIDTDAAMDTLLSTLDRLKT